MGTKKVKANIEAIAGFKTSDGEFFADHEVAIEHQRKLNLKQRIYDFAEDKFYSGMDSNAVCDILNDNFQEIIDIVWDLFEDKLPIDYSDC
jgi:hypothetical protein